MGVLSRMVVAMMPLIPKPLVGFAAKPYVAGITLDQAMEKVRLLAEEGARVTMDVLGESVTSREMALSFVEDYLRLIERIQADKVTDPSVSVKPTMLGLDLGEDFCHDNIDRICAAAKERGIHITIDMENHQTTDATLRIYKAVHAKYGTVGTVLQAYMRRTLADIDGLPEAQAHIRLCKGIYIEPRTVAWKQYETVRANYLAALRKLLTRGVYVGIATHDEHLVHGAMALIDELKLQPGQYEFQMLLGVDPSLRQIIIRAGHKLRVYVPFGPHWYAYSTRRLRENPDMANHVIKAFFGIRPK